MRLALLASVCAFSFGAVVTVAYASSHYHVSCVGNGFVHGDSTTDGSFFSRVESGCSSATRSCTLFVSGSYIGQILTSGSSTCNLWSRTYGNYSECAGMARVRFDGVFSEHDHYANNRCI